MNPKSESKRRWRDQCNKLLAMHATAMLFCLVAARTPAQVYSVLHTFDGPSGQFPGAPLTCSGGTLYGLSDTKVFRVNTDGTGFTVVYVMAPMGDTGESRAGIVVSNSTLYVVTRLDSAGRQGSVFKVNTNGTGYALIKQFTGDTNGGYPLAAPILSGNTLFGTTYSGGNSNCGVVFKVNTDGTDFRVLHSFSGGSDGSGPQAGLLLDGTTLFGVTGSGGISNRGTIFRINTDGSGYSLVKQFTGGGDGAYPESLVLSGTSLFGTTVSGGTGPYGGFGTVFKINHDGSGFTVLHKFAGGSEGNSPRGCLAVCGSTLFGCANGDGVGNRGTVFKVNSDGAGFSVLKLFGTITNGLTNLDGWNPLGGVVLCGTNLYGTTYWGGSNYSGVLFSLGPPLPAIVAAPQSQTVELGSTARFQVRAAPIPLTYQWCLNGTNVCAETATNATLAVTNVHAYDVGAYTVTVSNEFGTITSDPAMLNVIPPVDRRAVPVLNLLGETGSTVNVEYADVLGSSANWLPMDTVNLTGPPQLYFDLTTPLPPQRFYRVWQTGAPTVPPTLNLPFLVPAITLTGNVSDHLRLDYINQFGPTDAWMTLDTVTLTNTSQLYLDTSAHGQPRRLYRIVPVP